MFLRRIRYYLRFLVSLCEINGRLLWGMWKLTRLRQPAITIFGGARIKLDSEYAHQAADLAKKLVAHGYSIITGGGPGIMKAANYGAMEFVKECRIKEPGLCKEKVSAGIGLLQLNLEEHNEFLQENIIMSHFFSRKWLLVRYSEGFVVFPGGYGTLDEFFEILTLRQTHKMQQAPIILMDTEFWAPVLEWRDKKALQEGLISQEDLSLFVAVDTVDEAFAILNEQFCRLHQNRP